MGSDSSKPSSGKREKSLNSHEATYHRKENHYSRPNKADQTNQSHVNQASANQNPQVHRPEYNHQQSGQFQNFNNPNQVNYSYNNHNQTMNHAQGYSYNYPNYPQIHYGQANYIPQQPSNFYQPPPPPYAPSTYQNQNQMGHQAQSFQRVEKQNPANIAASRNSGIVGELLQKNSRPETKTVHTTVENKPASGTKKKSPTVPKQSITIDFDREFGTIKDYFNKTSDSATKTFNKNLSIKQKPSIMRKHLINNKHLSDVKIYVGATKTLFYGHKLFLITSSSFFKETIVDEGKTEIYLSEIDLKVFQDLMGYCYTGEITINNGNVHELQKTCKALKFLHVYDRCTGFISSAMKPDSVFKLLAEAFDKNDEKLINSCVAYIKTNEAKCFESPGFFQTPFEVLLKILQKCNFEDSSKNGKIIEKYTSGSGRNDPIDSNAGASAVKVDSNGKASGVKVDSNSSSRKSSLEGPPTPVLSVPTLDKLITVEKSVKFVVEDDAASVCDDKEETDRVTVQLIGKCTKLETQLSLINFVCKKSLFIHAIYFTSDLAENSREFNLSIFVSDGKWNREIFSRKLKHDPAVQKYRLSRFILKHQPLKIYIGQKFTVKVKFEKPCEQRHLAVERTSNESLFQLANDNEKKYFNCVSRVLVSEIPKE